MLSSLISTLSNSNNYQRDYSCAMLVDGLRCFLSFYPGMAILLFSLNTAPPSVTTVPVSQEDLSSAYEAVYRVGDALSLVIRLLVLPSCSALNLQCSQAAVLPNCNTPQWQCS